MKTAVFGCTGMLGGMLMKVLERDGLKPAPVPEDEVDIRDFTAVKAAVEKIKPGAVINAAAYTNVDGCEENRELAFSVNAAGAGNIARAAVQAGAANIYISSDYVFGGTKTEPYYESDEANPQGVYAVSKWEGEVAVRAEGGDWYILRTAWLYGPGGKNFVDTMLKLSGERDELKVVNDQIGCPTYTGHLAQAISKVLSCYYDKKTGAGEVYHTVGSGHCSWYEFACKIVELGGNSGRCKVRPVTTEEYIASLNKKIAPRPAHSVLDCGKTEKTFGIKMPDWKDALAEYLAVEK